MTEVETKEKHYIQHGNNNNGNHDNNPLNGNLPNNNLSNNNPGLNLSNNNHGPNLPTKMEKIKPNPSRTISLTQASTIRAS